MKSWNRKTVIGLVVGTFILAGAVLPFMVQAAENEGFGGGPGHPGFHQRQFDPDKMAGKLADTFGVSKDEVLQYNEQGINFRDISRASFLAKAGGYSLKEVMAAKTYDNTWKTVAQNMGITKEKMKATRQDMAATVLDKKLSIAKEVSLPLLQQGYRGRDIAVANELSKNTGKPVAEVLSLRKINNTWRDVAETLGVDDNTFKQDMKNLKTAFPQRGFHHKRFADA
ncbi:MAG: hypothetical protein P4N41_14455 [Negativicutes bacterium]|nr:hypothetical protein [Negativicutes bacterium]